MNKPDDPQKMPTERKGEWALVVAKAALSLIPFAGGPAAEVLGAIVQPQIEKRKTEWLESIAHNLDRLSTQVDGLTPERLAESPEFTTAFLQASQVALRTHQREKLDALRNAVLNVAIGTAPDDSLQTVFLALIESLTPWHLKLLTFLDDPMGWFSKNGLQPPAAPSAKGSNLISYTFPKLQVRDTLPGVYLQQLVSQGLLRDDWDELLSYKLPEFSGSSRTTPFGKQFLAFINSPITVERVSESQPGKFAESN